MAKPDNRADNEAHLQKHIDHTINNLHEAEAYLNAHGSEIPTREQETIAAKNDRRRESIKGFVAEKKDEAKQ